MCVHIVNNFLITRKVKMKKFLLIQILIIGLGSSALALTVVPEELEPSAPEPIEVPVVDPLPSGPESPIIPQDCGN